MAKPTLFGATYPSTSAIESAYDAVATDALMKNYTQEGIRSKETVIRLVG